MKKVFNENKWRRKCRKHWKKTPFRQMLCCIKDMGLNQYYFLTGYDLRYVDFRPSNRKR